MAKRPAEIQQKNAKIKSYQVQNGYYISRLSVLVAPSGSRRNAGTCTESDNANVSGDGNPSTNVEEMDNDDQEDDNLSCSEDEIITSTSYWRCRLTLVFLSTQTNAG